MRKLTVAAIALAICSTTGSAWADDEATKLPVRYVDRPLTLPKLVLSPALGSSLGHGDELAVNTVGLDLGAAIGLTDDLSVDVTPLTMRIVRTDFGGAPQTEVAYGTLRLGATYRFFHAAPVDLGARVEAGLTDSIETDDFLFHLTGQVPVRLRLGHVVRIDTGVAITGLFTTSGGDPDAAMATWAGLPFGIGPGIPVLVAFQIVDPLFVGLDTG
jgi:hypothetical protein